LKSGTFGVPGLILPGRGTAWRESGTSREIRDGWQVATLFYTWRISQAGWCSRAIWLQHAAARYM